MKVIIFGASGMIGTALTKAFSLQHDLTLVGRNAKKLQKKFGDVYNLKTWQEINPELMAQQDISINLTGENIGAKRWTAAQKKEIITSRVATTKKIADIAASLKEQSPRLINANAIGAYGIQPTIEKQNQVVYTEESAIPQQPNDFLAEVGLQWHQALQPAVNANIPVTECRFAVVLSKKGGMLSQLLPTFKLGLGAVQGTGKQPISWVTLDDLIAALLFIIDHPQENGIFNIVADEVVSQKQFAKTLANVLNRPCFFTLPAFVIKILFGEMGEELLLNGQNVKANKLRELGFKYEYDELKPALHALLNSNRKKSQ